MQVLHFSDNHGHVPNQVSAIRYDVVVCSGDFMPDRYLTKDEQVRLNQDHRRPATPYTQKTWLDWNADRLRVLCGNKPFLFCPGNHDFYGYVVEDMRAMGIDAHSLVDSVVEVGGLRWTGFPYVPWIGPEWAFSTEAPRMLQKVDELVERCNREAVDVLVTHCPPFGSLDVTVHGQHCGITALRNALDYGRFVKPLRAILCGHIHYGAGWDNLNGTVVSNAAVTVHVLPL
jgi:Icc-related predicted phosphoesterase